MKDVLVDTAAIQQVVAAQIVASLGTEHRDALLTKGVEAALSEWQFKRVVEDSVAADGARIAAEMLATPEWQERIRAAVLAGIEKLESQLPRAIYNTLALSLAGSEKEYGTRGGTAIHKWLSVPKENP